MKKILTFLLAVLLVAPQLVLADGIIIPPPDQNVTEAQQRAFIAYQGGVEDLFLTVEFSGDARKFAWLIPVPSRPEIKRGSDEIFTKLGEITRPKQNLLEKIKGVSAPYSLLKGIAPEMGMGGGGRGVEVIESKKVGILDVNVLTAISASDLEKWLKDNGYKVPGEEVPVMWEENVKERAIIPPEEISKTRQIFQDYLDQGWVFVAAKIAPEFLRKIPVPTGIPIPLKKESQTESKPVVEPGLMPAPPELIPPYYYQQAHITPLHLKFKTPKIVYPMKISSISNSSPSILLYVLADNKKTVANYQNSYVEKEEERMIFKTEYSAPIPAEELKEWLPEIKSGYLTKLYASYIYSDQMTEDLRFENAKNNKPVGTGEMTKKEWLLIPIYLLIYGPVRILGWFSQGPFWGVMPGFFPIVLISFVGSFGFIWVLIFYALLSRARRKVFRLLLYFLQFPGVWALVNFLSLVFVIPAWFIMTLFGVDLQTVTLGLFLKNNFGVILFTAIFYTVQAKIHLLWQKKE